MAFGLWLAAVMEEKEVQTALLRQQSKLVELQR